MGKPSLRDRRTLVGDGTGHRVRQDWNSGPGLLSPELGAFLHVNLSAGGVRQVGASPVACEVGRPALLILPGPQPKGSDA